MPVTGGLHAPRAMAVIPAARLPRPHRWPGTVAWTLWALVMVACAVVPWLDRLLRQAGRPDLTQWDVRPGLAVASAATIGALLASRRPHHPVGWLLLAQAVSLLATGAAAQSRAWGAAGRSRAAASHPRGGPGLPRRRGGGADPAGLVLLLTPTGSLPSPGRRRWARAMVAVPVVVLVVVVVVVAMLTPGSVAPYQ